MRFIAGGLFGIGSDQFYLEEAAACSTEVASFWIDRTLVTNAQFVAATGHVTCAEIAPDSRDLPHLDLAMLRPGSLLVELKSPRVALDDASLWRNFWFEANWRHPLRAERFIVGLKNRPVIHVAYPDAEAYAAWAGKSLPTEVEWDTAARGGLADAEYAWGDNLASRGACWPTLPAAGHRSAPQRSECRRGRRSDGGHPATPGHSKVIEGGSHLCAEDHCRRHSPAPRQLQAIDKSIVYIGFRCVGRDAT